ncbi:hypothetical protein CMV_026753 [Castanea mollissima]|uniref:Uncharacterized protein n=1 Tax=Castanea mollissima TaxID=60419 RepID=A0A8J4QAL9_9ROSI|nr:hypothetical protein CMV_026753 [Castanea mollissima]
MASSDQDILRKMEEMMARMTTPIIERLHHLKDGQGKKKKVVQEHQDEDSIFDDDFEEKEVKINKEPRKKEKSKETKEMSQEIKKMKDILKRYIPNTSAPNYNASEYCKYHLNHSHSTDKYTHLRHDIEDLIQSGKIPKPPINLLNIKTNPLPNYNVVPPPTWG